MQKSTTHILSTLDKILNKEFCYNFGDNLEVKTTTEPTENTEGF